MSNIFTALVLVWTLNLIMAFASLAMADIGPSENSFYNCSGTILDSYTATSNCQAITMPSNDLAGELPGSAATINEDTGFGFLDWISSTKSWVEGQLKYFGAVVAGPYDIIKRIPMPESAQSFHTLIGVMWYALSVFLLVAFVLGRP